MKVTLLPVPAFSVQQEQPDQSFRDFGASKSVIRRFWTTSSSRRTLSQFRSFKIRRTTFSNYIKSADFLILRLCNCKRVRRVIRSHDCAAPNLSKGRSGVAAVAAAAMSPMSWWSLPLPPPGAREDAIWQTESINRSIDIRTHPGIDMYIELLLQNTCV